MLSEQRQPQVAVTAAPVPEWLRGLVRAVRREGLQSKDARVKSLWDLLRQRQMLGRSSWLMAVLWRSWEHGLPARERPRSTWRMVRLLRRWGILPPPVAPPTGSGVSIAIHPAAPVSLVPVRPVAVPPFRPPRPNMVRPVRPVTVRPLPPPARRR